MYEVYNRWPEHSEEAFNTKYEKLHDYDIDHIVFAGMGGSGTLGDFFASILSKENIHVSVVKGYLLPKTVDSKTLVVATSVSGNTIETLTVLDSARKLDCKLVAFSSGGKMKEFCMKNRIEYRDIPLIHSPRASFPTFLFSIVNILDSILPIKKEDIQESILELKKLKKEIATENFNESNTAFTIAKWINGIPMIYYPFGLQAAATRFKNSLQENAKIHAFIEDVVEASHNGIVAWERATNVKPIILRGQDDFIKTKERWDILKEFFEQKGIDYREIFSVNGSIFSKLINLIYLLDFVSIYLALLSKVDPSPVEPIDFIKARI